MPHARIRPGRSAFCEPAIPSRRAGGLALILGGLALIVVATTRFVRTGRLLDDPEMHSASSVRAELILSVVLVLFVAGFSAFLVLG